MKSRFLSGVTALIAVSGCAVVGPEYQRPDLDLPNQFALQAGGALDLAAADSWWKELNDPALDRLIEIALANNNQIDASLARIAEARAILQTTGLSSQLSGGASAQVLAVQNLESGATSDSTRTGLDALFEFDVFGGRRRSEEQAEALFIAAVQDEAGVRLALISEISDLYYTARLLQDLRHTYWHAVESGEQLVELVSTQHSLGEATSVALRRTQAELELDRALLPQAEGDFQINAFALATLINEPADQVLDILGGRRSIPQPKSNYNVEIPASLLRNRPDIRASEARLVAATAEIGVFEAQLFPSINLSGTLSAVGSAGTVTFGPSVDIPIFDLPVRRARVEASRARVLEAEANYRQTVLEAIEEVQGFIAQMKSSREQLVILGRAEAAYLDTVALSQEAFESGGLTLINVLDSENALRDTAGRRAQLEREYVTAWSQLNIALGQGRDYAPRSEIQ